MRTLAMGLALIIVATAAVTGCSPGSDEVVPPASAVAAGGAPVPVAGAAPAAAAADPYLPGAGYILTAVLVGLILAVAFQMLLTNLSVAAGISMLGPLDEEDGGKDGRKKRNAKMSLPSTEEVAEEAREITRSFGLWAVITTALSLFAASWLASELGLIGQKRSIYDTTGAGNVLLGALIGLTIWGLFYTLLTMLEGMAITSAIGSLIRTAMAGFRSVASATSSLFEPSAKRQASDMAEGMTKAVADVLERDGSSQRLKRELRDYLRELKPRPIEPGAIRRQVAGLLDDLELHAVSAGGGGPVIDVEEVVADLRSRGTLGTEDVEAVRRGLVDAFDVAREEAADPTKGAAEATLDAVQRLTGRSRRSAEAGRRRLEEYLRRTELAELDPEGIKRDLTRLITEPRVGAEALRARVALMDRDTVRSLLAARGDVSEAEADRIVENVDEVVRSVSGLAASGREELEQRLAQVEGGIDAVRSRAERKLRRYFASLGQPELNYDDLKDDVALLFHDPKAGAEAMRDRWQAMDRDTLRAVIASSRSDLDEDDAEAMLAQLESVRDEALAQAEKLKTKARRELRRVRREALEQAEEVRKVAAEAAWWTFGTAAVSAAMAILGGVLGASELFGDDRGRVAAAGLGPMYVPPAAAVPVADPVASPRTLPATPPGAIAPRTTISGAADVPVRDEPAPTGISPAADAPAGAGAPLDPARDATAPGSATPAAGAAVPIEPEPSPPGQGRDDAATTDVGATPEDDAPPPAEPAGDEPEVPVEDKPAPPDSTPSEEEPEE